LVELDLFLYEGRRRKIIRLLRTAFDPQYYITPLLHHSMGFQSLFFGARILYFIKASISFK
jgi:hypothetical protein